MKKGFLLWYKLVNLLITPYIMSKEYIDWILEMYNVDFIVYGNDSCIVDGKGVYEETAK
jgi:ethanolamine-phosphate cytidylyltransferase